MNRLACLVSILGLTGCNSSGGGTVDAGPPPADLATPPRPPLGMKIPAPATQWTWVDFPDSSCDDGTPTGIAINPGTSNNLIFFMNGGGACWDYETCVVANTSTHGPFGKAEFAALGNDVAGSIFDRSDAQNLFKDWSYVFVPYCTGDLHGGDNVITYTGGGPPKTIHHKGHANMLAFVPRIAGTFPSPDKVVVSGSSAGGYGTGLNYDLVRSYYPAPKMYMIDDSGPPLGAADFPAGFRDAFFKSWNLGADLDPVCSDCRADFAAIIPALAKKYPRDRFSLLSSLQDKTISGYLFLSPSGFQTAVLLLASDVIDPQANFKYFLIPGNTHTMLARPASATYTSNGVGLWTFLGQQLNDDAAWKSSKPPPM